MLASILANLMMIPGGEPIPTNVPTDDIVDFGTPQGGIKKTTLDLKKIMEQDEETVMILVTEFVISNCNN